MIEWIILIIAVVLIWLFFKMKHSRYKFYAIILIFLLVFFYSGYKVIKDNKINIASLSGAIKTVQVYFVWISSIFHNGKEIVGSVIKNNFGGNSTIS